jgi:hypothetical protein
MVRPRGRRRFLARLGAAAAGCAIDTRPLFAQAAAEPVPAVGATLAELGRTFPDLFRHFLFEYYPWYGRDPWRHWDQWGRRPPHDLASNYVPLLGAYDSREPAVLERHARWIAESGVGGVSVSWWGGGSFEDQAAHRLLDVLRDHGLKAAFHLEPYRPDRAARLAEDVLYLLRVFGERRKFDALLLLRDADGREAPVFKTFHTILPRRAPHCRGGTRPVSGYAADATWARQIETVRGLLRRDFPRLTLLADSLHMPRTRAAGFDGVAIYDNTLGPEAYPGIAAEATRAELLFSLNVNPGFDAITPRRLQLSDCYSFPPRVPVPPRPLDLSRPADREVADALARARIAHTLAASLRAQADPASSNARRGFLLVFVNSFNEWHEGHAFEPMKDAAELGAEERLVGYHNPARGDGRLSMLRALLAERSAAPASPTVSTTTATSSSPSSSK